MADKVELLHLPRSGDSSIVLSETRSILLRVAVSTLQHHGVQACTKLFAGPCQVESRTLIKQVMPMSNSTSAKVLLRKSAQEDDARQQFGFANLAIRGMPAHQSASDFENKDGEGVSQTTNKQQFGIEELRTGACAGRVQPWLAL